MDTESNDKTVNILLIEDNYADIRIITEVLKEFRTRPTLYVVNNGVEALEFLNKKGKHKNKCHPDLILLDLNIPLLNGFEVLKEIKIKDNLKNIPVIILTTSNTEEDISKACELQVNCFITKPLCFDEYKLVLEDIEKFWLNFDYSAI
ncbi:response regulator [Methanobacterium sp.]|uniref:response regulator n=1 Tax=Methanobacterium sp. TaxID=2164 RepID=UPI003C740FD4